MSFSARAFSSADSSGGRGALLRSGRPAGTGIGGTRVLARFGSGCLSAGVSIAAGPTTSSVLPSASRAPSTETRVTTSTERPETPAGILAFKVARPNRGMAQDPGPMTCPSLRETLGGSPRRRMKLLAGSASRGPTWIAIGICDAGSARIVAAIPTWGSARCATRARPAASAHCSMPLVASTASAMAPACTKRRLPLALGAAPTATRIASRRSSTMQSSPRCASGRHGLSVIACFATCSTPETSGTAAPAPPCRRARRGPPAGGPAAHRRRAARVGPRPSA